MRINITMNVGEKYRTFDHVDSYTINSEAKLMYLDTLKRRYIIPLRCIDDVTIISE